MSPVNSGHMSSNKNDIENELIELNIKIGEAENDVRKIF